MPLLASKANPRFKALLARLRPGGAQRRSTLLLGGKLIEAWAERRKTPAGGRLRPALWLRLDGAAPHPLAAELGLETLVLGESLLRELADAGSPPEHALLAEVGAEPTGPLPGRVIGAWGIQDPGNLGALLRSAAAFGFQEALLGPGCADPFSPKALRGSMGAAFLMPLRRVAIPTTGVESLNAAVAAGIACFEAARRARG